MSNATKIIGESLIDTPLYVTPIYLAVTIVLC